MQLETLRQNAYSRIRQMLVSGQIGAGRQLSELRLAKELGMSRTPVREAIRQMEMEGLLEYAPHYGAVVRKLDREELEEMYSVREVLESYTAAHAAQRLTAEQLARLRRLCGTMRTLACRVPKLPGAVLEGQPLARFVLADMEFHRMVIAAAGNRFMSRILDTTHLLKRLFESTHWVYDRRALAEANWFHGRLLRALEAHDPKAARHWTVEAMRVSKRNALTQFAHSRSLEEDSLDEGVIDE